MPLPPPTIFVPGLHDHLIPSLATIHIACVETDHTLATYLPPFSKTDDGAPDSKVVAYWQRYADQVVAGTRVILVQMLPSDTTDKEEVVGYVSLEIQATETGPFRGGVQKLLVSPRHRQKGIAKNLMAELERIARERGTTMLTLDTEVGSPAELVYPRLGWTLIGVIPRFGVSPKDGRLTDEAFFYKDLSLDN